MKKALVLTAIGIFIVFGAIGAILLFSDVNWGRARTTDAGLEIIYSDGRGAQGRQATRHIALDEETEATLANEIRLATPGELNFVNPGFSFVGWSHGHQSQDIIEYVPGGLTKETPRSERTFVARWTPGQFTLSFEAAHPSPLQHGLGVPANQVVTFGQTLSLNFPGFVQNYTIVEGFVFQGWRTQPNGAGRQVVHGDTFNFTDHTVLFGWWITPTANNNRIVTVQTRTTTGGVGPRATRTYNVTLGQQMGALVSYHDRQEFRDRGFTFSHFSKNNRILPIENINGAQGVRWVVESNSTLVVYYIYTPQGGNNGCNGNQITRHNVTAIAVNLGGGSAVPWAGGSTFLPRQPNSTNPAGLFDNGFRMALYRQNQGNVIGWDIHVGWRLERVTVNGVQHHFAGNPARITITITANTTIRFYYRQV